MTQINGHQLPVELAATIQAGSVAGLARRVCNFLKLEGDEVCFRIFDVETMERETKEQLQLARSQDASLYCLRLSREVGKGAGDQSGYLDAEKSVVIGGSTGSEDALVLDYSESESAPKLMYFSGCEEPAGWRLVALSFGDVLTA